VALYTKYINECYWENKRKYYQKHRDNSTNYRFSGLPGVQNDSPATYTVILFNLIGSTMVESYVELLLQCRNPQIPHGFRGLSYEPRPAFIYILCPHSIPPQCLSTQRPLTQIRCASCARTDLKLAQLALVPWIRDAVSSYRTDTHHYIYSETLERSMD